MVVQDIAIPVTANSLIDGVTLNVSNGKIQIKDDGVTLDKIKDSDLYKISPIGTILPFLKSYTNTPSLPEGWVECNGQTLDDEESVFDGQVIPDLNGNNYCLYGHSASGTTKTEDFLPNHKHGFRCNDDSLAPANLSEAGVEYSNQELIENTTSGTATKFYSVVWIMRVK